MNKTQSAAVLALGIALGVGGSSLTGIINSAHGASIHFQNENVWVARLAPDGGQPAYGGRECGFVSDGGVVPATACVEGELTPDQSTAFEAFLTSLGIAPPR